MKLIAAIFLCGVVALTYAEEHCGCDSLRQCVDEQKAAMKVTYQECAEICHDELGEAAAQVKTCFENITAQMAQFEQSKQSCMFDSTSNLCSARRVKRDFMFRKHHGKHDEESSSESEDDARESEDEMEEYERKHHNRHHGKGHKKHHSESSESEDEMEERESKHRKRHHGKGHKKHHGGSSESEDEMEERDENESDEMEDRESRKHGKHGGHSSRGGHSGRGGHGGRGEHGGHGRHHGKHGGGKECGNKRHHGNALQMKMKPFHSCMKQCFRVKFPMPAEGHRAFEHKRHMEESRSGEKEHHHGGHHPGGWWMKKCERRLNCTISKVAAMETMKTCHTKSKMSRGIEFEFKLQSCECLRDAFKIDPTHAPCEPSFEEGIHHHWNGGHENVHHGSHFY